MIIKFIKTTKEKYDLLNNKNDNALYFIEDEKRIYKGEHLYNDNIIFCDQLPILGEFKKIYIPDSDHKMYIWTTIDGINQWKLLYEYSRIINDSDLPVTSNAVKDYVNKKFSEDYSENLIIDPSGINGLRSFETIDGDFKINPQSSFDGNCYYANNKTSDKLEKLISYPIKLSNAKQLALSFVAYSKQGDSKSYLKVSFFNYTDKNSLKDEIIYIDKRSWNRYNKILDVPKDSKMIKYELGVLPNSTDLNGWQLISINFGNRYAYNLDGVLKNLCKTVDDNIPNQIKSLDDKYKNIPTQIKTLNNTISKIPNKINEIDVKYKDLPTQIKAIDDKYKELPSKIENIDSKYSKIPLNLAFDPDGALGMKTFTEIHGNWSSHNTDNEMFYLHQKSGDLEETAISNYIYVSGNKLNVSFDAYSKIDDKKASLIIYYYDGAESTSNVINSATIAVNKRGWNTYTSQLNIPAKAVAFRYALNVAANSTEIHGFKHLYLTFTPGETTVDMSKLILFMGNILNNAPQYITKYAPRYSDCSRVPSENGIFCFPANSLNSPTSEWTAMIQLALDINNLIQISYRLMDGIMFVRTKYNGQWTPWKTRTS